MPTLVSLPNEVIERVLTMVLRQSVIDFQNITFTCSSLRKFYVIMFPYYPVHISNPSQYHAFIASSATTKNHIKTLNVLGKYVQNFPMYFSFNRLTNLCLKGSFFAIYTCLNVLPQLLSTLKIVIDMRNFKRNCYHDANRAIIGMEATNIPSSCRLNTICMMSESPCVVSRSLKWPIKAVISGRRAHILGIFLGQLLYIFRDSIKYIELVRIDLAILYTLLSFSLSLPYCHFLPSGFSVGFPHLETVIIDSTSHRNAAIWKSTPTPYTIFWIDYLDLFIYVRKRTSVLPWIVIAPEDIKNYPHLLWQIPSSLRLYAGIRPTSASDLATIFQIDHQRLNRLARHHRD